MEKSQNYHVEKSIKNTLKLREVLKTLPAFSRDYFRALEQTTTAKTRISYIYDIRIFFNYILKANPLFKNKLISDITLNDLDSIQPVDIEEYLEYLKVYHQEGKTLTNSERGIHRKLSALRSFYHYFHKHQMIQTNPTLIVDLPKLHDKEIIRLDYDEVASLLDAVESGENLTGMKKLYFEKNKYRNLAIFTLLLGTGIRVSECVGLDINDLDFKNNRIKIIRKGGKEDFVYFGTEVEKALKSYLQNTRTQIKPISGHENALFLSIQKRRISVQGIEDLVKEYASKITSVKHITPHKLRSTYGTSLYRETGDIYLVAEVLGHNDVNTTRKHYAALDEDRKRSAAKAVTLRQ